MRARYRLSLFCSVEMLRGYLFLLVGISVLLLVSAEKSPVEVYLQGIVGRSVHMRCVLDDPRGIERVYFQTKDSNESVVFVNGFYDKRELHARPEYKNRTIVNRSQISMELLNLTPDDEGDYECIPWTINAEEKNKTKFHLTVTANYSVPNITVQGCGIYPGAHNCVITCSSSGGFPKSNVTWNVARGNMRSLLREEGELVLKQDKYLKVWNVSQFVGLNCSRLLNISCSVGGVVSQAVSVCLPVHVIDITTVACAVLLLVSFVIVIIVVIKRRTTHRIPSEDGAIDAELASLNSGQAG
ncbi:T-lymphocyte activation antigen CD80 isoform X3 [Tachysurus fulvidraco]|uniref:T-lymphocyte activation antigen CD80 isoform X3 n=1 Tax=Tachysurus fulvidraco TaxID=1234273 RepID=UPI000F4EF87F|nr:T-lymphocyte activation antigen CD80 isoform X3 [Tachysurus fulvidraco]